MLEKGISSTTLEFKISLVRAITLETGRIRAEGKVLNCGRRVGTAEGRVTDAKGRLLAHGTTTCLSRQNHCSSKITSTFSTASVKVGISRLRQSRPL
jgi:acyl-coenzyme A thioesterase PaaI-like protein